MNENSQTTGTVNHYLNNSEDFKMFVFLSLDKVYLNLNHVVKIEYKSVTDTWDAEIGEETTEYMELYLIDESQMTIDYQDGIDAIKEKTGITKYTDAE